jgi:hypothetical protein
LEQRHALHARPTHSKVAPGSRAAVLVLQVLIASSVGPGAFCVYLGLLSLGHLVERLVAPALQARTLLVESKARAHHAAPALINPTVGNRAAVCVVLVRSAAALVRLHVRLVLLGRFKDQRGSRRACLAQPVHTAAAEQCNALHARPGRFKAAPGSRAAFFALLV